MIEKVLRGMSGATVKSLGEAADYDSLCGDVPRRSAYGWVNAGRHWWTSSSICEMALPRLTPA